MAGFRALLGGLLGRGLAVSVMLGVCAGGMFMASGKPLVGAAQLVINELNSPLLMALPLFVMAAAFMRFGGIANALVNLAAARLGLGNDRHRHSAQPAADPVRNFRLIVHPAIVPRPHSAGHAAG